MRGSEGRRSAGDLEPFWEGDGDDFRLLEEVSGSLQPGEKPAQGAESLRNGAPDGLHSAVYAAFIAEIVEVVGGGRSKRRLAGVAVSPGRAIAGLTSANISVASAYITDISPEDTRARRFGLFNAMFGAGFIIGPVLGGLRGDTWLRLPFLAAAVLNACNLLLAVFILPESRTPARQKIDLADLNPLRPLRWVFSMKGLLPIVLVFFVLSGAGEVYGTCWALWGFDTFRWNGLWIGLSLGTFGVCQTLVQAFLPGPATKLFGDRGAVLVGIACSCVALIVIAFANQGWIVFAIMPVFALTGLGTPALQALATRQVDATRQGQVQGVMASAVSLASIVAPLAFSTFYFMVQKEWPGAIWLSVVVIYAIAVPLVFLGTRTACPTQPASP